MIPRNRLSLPNWTDRKFVSLKHVCTEDAYKNFRILKLPQNYAKKD